MAIARTFNVRTLSYVAYQQCRDAQSKVISLPRLPFGKLFLSFCLMVRLRLSTRACTTPIYQTSAVEASDNRFNRWTVREIAAASSRAPSHNVKLTERDPTLSMATRFERGKIRFSSPFSRVKFQLRHCVDKLGFLGTTSNYNKIKPQRLHWIANIRVP